MSKYFTIEHLSSLLLESPLLWSLRCSSYLQVLKQRRIFQRTWQSNLVPSQCFASEYIIIILRALICSLILLFHHTFFWRHMSIPLLWKSIQLEYKHNFRMHNAFISMLLIVKSSKWKIHAWRHPQNSVEELEGLQTWQWGALSLKFSTAFTKISCSQC